MNTKPVPIVIVLLASAISCIVSVIQQVEFATFFFRLVQSVVIFAIVGITAKLCLDYAFNKKNREVFILEEEEEEEDLDDESDEEDVENRQDNIALEPEVPVANEYEEENEEALTEE